MRHHLLLGPEGQWREYLWLDHLVAPPAVAAQTPEKPRLTGPLPINSCSVDSLTLLPGVGAVLAGRIDTARRDGMVFRNAADLRQVKGIGPRLSARLDTLVIYAPQPDSTAGSPSGNDKSR